MAVPSVCVWVAVMPEAVEVTVWPEAVETTVVVPPDAEMETVCVCVGPEAVVVT